MAPLSPNSSSRNAQLPPAHLSPPSTPSAAVRDAGALEQELDAFRQQWLKERNTNSSAAGSSAASAGDRTRTTTTTTTSQQPTNGDAIAAQKRHSQRQRVWRAQTPSVTSVQDEMRGLTMAGPSSAEQARADGGGKQQTMLPTARTTTTVNGQKSALEVYGMAVNYEREGRLNDALTHYRRAFKMDPNVDRSFHRASIAPKSLRGSEPYAGSDPATARNGPAAASASADQEFKFERTIQVAPDYTPENEHRSVEAVERGMGKGKATADTTHPSSTGYLFDSLMRSIAQHPYERREDRRTVAADAPLSSASPPTSPTPASKAATSVQEALDSLTFIPFDPDKPVYLNALPREVLVQVLRTVALSSIVPPPRARSTAAHDDQLISVPSTGSSAPTTNQYQRKRGPRKKTLREVNREIESDLHLEPFDKRAWQIDIEALERFARTCRFARILTLDIGIWKAICQRIYVPPHQIRPHESIDDIVSMHGNDWRRCLIEHGRMRFDGCYISVVTYLRRGENTSWFAPSHLITFYRYLRFYDNGFVISLLTVDTPDTIVRHLNPALRLKGLTFGRWRLNDDNLVELWGLEDPLVNERDRKYSFRMTCRLKSTARGRMNKLEMVSMATEHRTTLELCDVPIKPTKPFFFSKVASYAGEALDEVGGLTLAPLATNH
ncbi:hypothetical protein OIV83_004363 [Microbotryomycetes sp. JL201]|nr:hypothetical protein OIV83_004363 [Microbotryomycetes sp. JL201]